MIVVLYFSRLADFSHLSRIRVTEGMEGEGWSPICPLSATFFLLDVLPQRDVCEQQQLQAGAAGRGPGGQRRRAPALGHHTRGVRQDKPPGLSIYLSIYLSIHVAC